MSRRGMGRRLSPLDGDRGPLPRQDRQTALGATRDFSALLLSWPLHVRARAPKLCRDVLGLRIGKRCKWLIYYTLIHPLSAS